MKKIILSFVVLSLLVLSMVTAAPIAATAGKNSRNLVRNKVMNTELSEEKIEELKAEVPELEFVEKQLEELSVRPSRFLLWTNNGQHIMWGTYGNGYFKGVDDQGKEAWGIYQNGIWAGFYNQNQFFYGKYSRGRWVAHGLFGMRTAAGRFVLFPSIRPLTTMSADFE